jgi:predicted  nucleic acid-binding Zn-ribbon protein
MTPEQMERAMEFLLNSQAQNAADIGKLTADVQGLKEVQAQASKDIVALAEAQAQTSKDIVALVDAVSRQEAQAESDRAEIRDAINNLIVANEVTRKLSEDVARLAVGMSQRVTDIERRVTDLESK